MFNVDVGKIVPDEVVEKVSSFAELIFFDMFGDLGG